MYLELFLNGAASWRRELHDEVELSRPQGQHQRRRALVERDLDAVERRRAAPVGGVAHELGAASSACSS